MIRRNPRRRSRPTIRFSRSSTARHRLAARPGFEPGPPVSGAGVVPFPPPRMGLNGEARTPNPRLPTPVRCRLSHVQPWVEDKPSVVALLSTDGGARTHTGGGLSAVPLPRLGYVSNVCVDRAGLEPAAFSLQGSSAPACAPARRRGGGGRTRSRRHMRPSVLRGAPLRATFPSCRAWWSRTTSSRGISAVPSPSGSCPAGDARVREPAAGIEPALSRVRAKRPFPQDLAGRLLRTSV
jgi:hypothetical protein